MREKSSQVIHLRSLKPTTFKPVLDEDFNVFFNNSLSYSREVTYCNWVEYREQHTEVTENNTHRTFYTYNYKLEWVNNQVPSYYFDSPIRHNNPFRIPIPSKTYYANYLLLNDQLRIDPSLIDQNPSEKFVLYRNYNFNQYALQHGFNKIYG